MAGSGKRKMQTNKQKRNSGEIKANVYHKGTYYTAKIGKLLSALGTT